ncbi:hypothetical protein [Megalodesulfovibrio gigas]|uniref:Nucleoside recognition domain protein n=1 Tax=Megalodesulfovibrio gigas (strain ATCC 19364 / DSM 1382 / NCIMB 9332 / VKM B-1759) TaxID=1121448 RepID=T2GBW9_MEGG1|nr:hypothetical protein [Megalodesulfovibrio gigas]AGW13417.1 hypothetical protein DGI_1584 [Megalodesulfovibrio gigas DSM 1382 = ATCC 19364]
MIVPTPESLLHGLLLPLGSLIVFMSLSLLVANVLEAMNWTRFLARLAAPLVRLGRFKDVSGASFSLAFVSGMAANTVLAESYERGTLSRRELILANLFNSMPTYFLHLPTMFSLAAPFLGSVATLYVGLTFFAAILRTAGVVLAGRLLLPPIPDGCVVCRLDEQKPRTPQEALARGWRLFRRRIRKVVLITAPIYTVMYFARIWGVFEAMETFLATHVGDLGFLPPQALSIVAFHLVAETTSGLAAAGAVLQGGELPARVVVLALLVGNILSSPMRAFRHQFPYYAGIFKPSMAARLIMYSQLLRAASIALVTAGFAFFTS